MLFGLLFVVQDSAIYYLEKTKFIINAGCAFGSVLKVASVWLAIIPGWTARVYYERCLLGEVGYDLWCGPTALVGNYDMSDSGDANRAYPLLVMRNFPRGV